MPLRVLLFVPILLLAACQDRATPAAPPEARTPIRHSRAREGQVQDLPSPDGALRVRVPIVSLPGREFATWWCPVIQASSGAPVFQDEACFPARFNVYWAWDEASRLWVYNSDDGRLWVYAEGAGGWGREAFAQGDGRTPPAALDAHRGR